MSKIETPVAEKAKGSRKPRKEAPKPSIPKVPEGFKIQTVPFGSLRADWTRNVGKDRADPETKTRIRVLADAFTAGRVYGFADPLLVSDAHDGTYNVEDGYTRHAALEYAKVPADFPVPIVVVPAGMSEIEKESLLLSMNSSQARSDYNPMRRALRHASLIAKMEETGISRDDAKEQAALASGIDAATLGQLLYLLEAPEAIREMLLSGRISRSVANQFLDPKTGKWFDAAKVDGILKCVPAREAKKKILTTSAITDATTIYRHKGDDSETVEAPVASESEEGPKPTPAAPKTPGKKKKGKKAKKSGTKKLADVLDDPVQTPGRATVLSLVDEIAARALAEPETDLDGLWFGKEDKYTPTAAATLAFALGALWAKDGWGKSIIPLPKLREGEKHITSAVRMGLLRKMFEEEVGKAVVRNLTAGDDSFTAEDISVFNAMVEGKDASGKFFHERPGTLHERCAELREAIAMTQPNGAEVVSSGKKGKK